MIRAALASLDAHEDDVRYERAAVCLVLAQMAADAGETQEAASEERWWDLDGSVGISSSVNYLSHDSPGGTD